MMDAIVIIIGFLLFFWLPILVICVTIRVLASTVGFLLAPIWNLLVWIVPPFPKVIRFPKAIRSLPRLHS